MKNAQRKFGFEEPQEVRSNGPLHVHVLKGRSNRLIVSLAGVGNRRNCVPSMEFIAVASNAGENHALFISDRSRSWMNGRGVASTMVRLVEDYRSRNDVSEVIALGNSMGGFSAIRLADLTAVDTVIAFAPQFSVDPALVPEEHQWMFFRKQIDRWPHRHVGDLSQQGTCYFLFHGDDPAETIHWSRFPWNRRLNHFIFTDEGHNIARKLRKRGLLQPVVNTAVEKRPRRVRKLLERKLFDRQLTVFRREAYQATRKSVFAFDHVHLGDRLPGEWSSPPAAGISQ